MIQHIFQPIVIVLAAIPFVYMAYDVSRELSVLTVKVIKEKIRPGVTSLINMLIN